MAGRRLPRLRLPFGLIIWAAIAMLLAVGLATTAIDFMHLPRAEAQRANNSGQRVIIDPASGAVSVGANAAHKPSFDVGTAEEAVKPEAPAEPALAPEAAKPETPAVAEPAATPTEPTAQAPTAVENPATPAGTLPAGLPTLRVQPLSGGIPPVPRGPESLINAPAPEVTEAIPGGTLVPRKGEKDTTPAVLYAHHFTRVANQHLLAFVVVDAGLDAQSLPLLMSLPPEVSVAVSPYGRNLKPSIQSLRNAGHEVWAMVPMIGERYPQDDPGPLGIIPTMPEEEVIRRLHEIMSITLGSVGMVLPPSEALSRRPDAFAPVLQEIEKRGLYVLSTHPTHSLRELTGGKENPILRRADLLLDTTANDTVIESKLAGLMQTAQKAEVTIVVTSARPQTLEILRNWFSKKSLDATVTLAPVSAAYRAVEAPAAAAEEGGHGEAAAEHGEKKEEGGHH